MTPIKNSVRYAVVGTSAVFSALLYVAGFDLEGFFKMIVSALPTIAVAGVMVFDKWVWKWPHVSRVHKRPRLDGLWRGELRPHPDSRILADDWRGSIPSFLQVEQTFWTIHVSQMTGESESRSRTSRFLDSGESAHQILSFIYDNTPRSEHRDRSPRHVGACELSVKSKVPTKLIGEYFTDRLTMGEMRLDLVDRTTGHADFAAAHEHAASADG